jgi:GrpB-like predicted nucleotidyltransferase (UPF0157 family)
VPDLSVKSAVPCGATFAPLEIMYQQSVDCRSLRGLFKNDFSGLQLLSHPVIIEEYDPRWPQLFALLRSQIAAVLRDLAISIEHVGSTAVLGLAAKPVIDIDVLLRSATYLPSLSES